MESKILGDGPESYFDGRIRIIPNRKTVKEMVLDMIQGTKGIEEAFYTCNLGELIVKHIEWMNCMPRVKPFYAVKCNDDAMLLELLAGLGTGFDCASKREMGKVIGMGVDPDNIIFANPVKQNSHIRAAEEYGIRTMTFDNEHELHKIKNLYPSARLVIRIRCDAQIAQCQLGMKFGVLVEEAPELLAIAKELDLDVIGVSFHVGSGCMEPAVFCRAIASAKWLFNVAFEIGFNMRLLDIGGGFPGNSGTSISEIANIVNVSLDEYFPKECGVEIIAEPGRYYAASAFTLVTKIHSMREIKGVNAENPKSFMYYINDGVYGSFNCVLYDHATVYPETLREIDGDLHTCSIWGPTCDGLDQVCSNIQLPRMQLGDWLLFNDMGAYTIAAAGTFNGFPVPKVQYVASREALNVLRLYAAQTNFKVIDDVEVFSEAAIGANRDAVGWSELGEDGVARVLNRLVKREPAIPKSLESMSTSSDGERTETLGWLANESDDAEEILELPQPEIFDGLGFTETQVLQ